MAGTNETTTRQSVQPRPVAEVVKQVRHKKCNARLFDARVQWGETPVREAILIIKCWRCNETLGLAPSDGYELVNTSRATGL
jgi:hypothetical protein